MLKQIESIHKLSNRKKSIEIRGDLIPAFNVLHHQNNLLYISTKPQLE